MLSKWLFANPDLLILDEPTRGIDVGAKYEIYTIINQLVSEGKSVLMISSEMPELLGVCDRIYVMNQGRLVGEMPASEAGQKESCAPSFVAEEGSIMTVETAATQGKKDFKTDGSALKGDPREYGLVLALDPHHALLPVYDQRVAYSSGRSI